MVDVVKVGLDLVDEGRVSPISHRHPFPGEPSTRNVGLTFHGGGEMCPASKLRVPNAVQALMYVYDIKNMEMEKRVTREQNRPISVFSTNITIWRFITEQAEKQKPVSGAMPKISR